MEMEVIKMIDWMQLEIHVPSLQRSQDGESQSQA